MRTTILTMLIAGLLTTSALGKGETDCAALETALDELENRSRAFAISYFKAAMLKSGVPIMFFDPLFLKLPSEEELTLIEIKNALLVTKSRRNVLEIAGCSTDSTDDPPTRTH